MQERDSLIDESVSLSAEGGIPTDKWWELKGGAVAILSLGAVEKAAASWDAAIAYAKKLAEADTKAGG